MRVTEFSPAKLNLYLAVTGRRADGFHDLVSVVAPLDFGDELRAELRPGGGCTLACDDPEVPVDGRNLVRRAAAAFAAATGWAGGVHFELTKRIPLGAGLGGGSSNAVAALRALNRLAGGPLAAAGLAQLAAELGSDCPLFLHAGPVVLRGRGERVEALAPAAARRLRGQGVVLLKPSFGVATPWAYGRLVERGSDYVPAAEAEARIAAWGAGAAGAEALLGNSFEPAVFAKYPALPLGLEHFRRVTGGAGAMSGSGSACFLLVADPGAVARLEPRVRAAWGPVAWVQAARLA